MKRAILKDDILEFLIRLKSNKYHGKTLVSTIAKHLGISEEYTNTLCIEIAEDKNIWYQFASPSPMCAIYDKGETFLKIDAGYEAIYEKGRNQKKTQNLKDWLLIVAGWIGGLGALSLVVWEIYKYFFLHKD